MRHLDGVHDDPEAGDGELVGVPQLVVVQVAEHRRTRSTISSLPSEQGRDALWTEETSEDRRFTSYASLHIRPHPLDVHWSISSEPNEISTLF